MQHIAPRFKVQGSTSTVQCPRSKVQDSRSKVQGPRSKVQGPLPRAAANRCGGNHTVRSVRSSGRPVHREGWLRRGQGALGGPPCLRQGGPAPRGARSALLVLCDISGEISQHATRNAHGIRGSRVTRMARRNPFRARARRRPAPARGRPSRPSAFGGLDVTHYRPDTCPGWPRLSPPPAVAHSPGARASARLGE